MRYRVLILLLILGCSMDLAPDNEKTDFIYSALEIIDRFFSVLDVFIGTILYTVKWSIVYFCYGLELYLELFCHMIHCLLVDICSDDMMHYYTCISNILQNLNNINQYLHAPPFHIVTILVTKLSPVQLQATGEGNIAPAKRGKRAQFLLTIRIAGHFRVLNNRQYF